MYTKLHMNTYITDVIDRNIYKYHNYIHESPSYRYEATGTIRLADTAADTIHVIHCICAYAMIVSQISLLSRSPSHLSRLPRTCPCTR